MPAKQKQSVQSTQERQLALAKRATANATRDNKIVFGAAVTVEQIDLTEKYLKGRDILKFLAVSEKQLRQYSRNEIPHSALPTKTKTALRAVCDKHKKVWARKAATISYILLLERKKRSKKPAAPKPTNSEQPSTD